MEGAYSASLASHGGGFSLSRSKGVLQHDLMLPIQKEICNRTRESNRKRAPFLYNSARSFALDDPRAMIVKVRRAAVLLESGVLVLRAECCVMWHMLIFREERGPFYCNRQWFINY